MYAAAVGGASALLAALYVSTLVPKSFHRWALAGGELAMCLAWVVLFGIFGRMYMGEDPENVEPRGRWPAVARPGRTRCGGGPGGGGGVGGDGGVGGRRGAKGGEEGGGCGAAGDG